MPAANLLTDEGNIATAVQNQTVLRTGAQHVSTQSDDVDGNCNIHVAILLLLAVVFILLLRKNGFHAIMVEG